QSDSDGDGIGDVCDTCGADPRAPADTDGDGTLDACDFDDGIVLFESIREWHSGGERTELNWQDDVAYDSFNLYRGDVRELAQGHFSQEPGSNPYADRVCGLTSTSYEDTLEPSAGDALYWLVTGVGAGGESGLGDGAGVDRPNDFPCP
ncbi:MAG: hypothetical protein D6718_06080, partial [Acidobacteria bacterium]